MSGKYIETKGGWNRKFAVAIFVFIFLMGFLVVGVQGVGAFPDTIDQGANVSEPSTINKSGTYDVNRSFDSGGEIVAIKINESNVTLNLNGHTISNNSSTGGILVQGSSNVTIAGQSGTVRNFTASGGGGVFVSGSTDSYVNNTHLLNNTKGVSNADGTKNTGIYGNTIENNTYGVEVEEKDNVINFDTLESDNTFLNNGKNVTIATRTVTFNVTNESGADLENATVVVGGQNNSTEANGNATFSLNDGSYDYKVSKDGYGTETGKIDVDGSDVTEDVTLNDGYTITFSVNNSSGTALENATATLYNGGQPFLDNRTNASGGAVFWVANDTYTYEVQKPGYAWAQERDVEVSGANISRDVTLEPGYGITLEVEDESGDPLESAHVNLKNLDQSDAGKNTTDETGTATIWQTNGTYKYEVTHEGKVSQAEQIKIDGTDQTQSVTLPDVQYTVTFNITNESGQPIPEPTYIMLYGDEYTKIHENVNDSGFAQYGLAATGTYTYVADADSKIRKGGQFEATGTDTEVNITLLDPDPTQLEGYARYPNGTAMEGANVTVKGLNESMFQDQEDPVDLNSTKTNSTGYFNLTSINETTSVPNLNKYYIDIRKYNDSNSDVLEYRSESYLQWIDEHAFERLGVHNYTLSEAVTYNVEAEGVPEYLDEVSLKDNASVTNYSHSLVWMNDTEQWAYVSNQSNLTILESDFTVNRTLDLPVDNASGLHYNGSHIYTLNTSGTVGTDGETRAYALNVSGTETITIEETFTLTEQYEQVFALEYTNDTFYVWGARDDPALYIDTYNDTFGDNESVKETGVPIDVDAHFHDDRWYLVTIEDDGNATLEVYNETFGPVTRVRGGTVGGIGLDHNTTGIAHNGTDWFLGSNETGNISTVHITDKGVKEMDYKVVDSVSDDILVESHGSGDFAVNEFSISHVADRDVVFTIDKNGTPLQINKLVSDVTDPDGWDKSVWNEDTRELNLTINLTQETRRVSGHVDYDGSDNFSNISVVYQEIDTNTLATHTGGYNRSAIHGEGDIYDPENGTYDIGIINPINETATYVIQITAENETEDEHYGAIKKLTLEPGGGDVSDFNATLQPLLGNETNLEVFGPTLGTQNVTTKMKRFQFVNSTGHTVESDDYGARVYMDYSEHFSNSTEVIWRRAAADFATNSNSSGFDVMAFGADGMYVNVYAAGYIPTSYSLSEEELKADGPVNISLTEFEEGQMILDEGKTPDIETYLYSGDTADQPHPAAADTVSESYVGQEPLKVRLENHQALLNILGGDVSFRMTDINNDITVHYSNVDASRSGAPDAFFSSQAETTGAGDDFESLWKFGSSGPSIYDKVLVSTPYNESAGENHTVNISYLYDEDMNVIWNASEDNVEDIPSHYDAYKDGDYRAYVNGTGVDCQVDDPDLSEGLCYKDEGNTSLWMEIPHFSAVGLNVGTADETAGDDGEEEEETTDDTSPSPAPSGDDDEPEPAPEPVVEEAIVDEITGEATASVDASAGQQVEIQIPSSAADTARESMIEGVTATSGTDQQISVSVRSVEREDVTVPSRESQVSFDEIDVEGDVEGATVTFSVRKDTLDEHGANPSDVVKERFDPEDEEWQPLETSVSKELDDRYRFEAEVPEFSLFATSIEAQEEPVTEEPTTEPAITDEPATVEEPPTEEPPGTEPAVEDEPVTEQPGEDSWWTPLAVLAVLLALAAVGVYGYIRTRE